MKNLLVVAVIVISLILLIEKTADAAPPQCTPVENVGDVCVTADNGKVIVTLIGNKIAEIDLPPQATVKVNVPGPTVVKKVPGPTRTVIKRVPGPTRTIAITRYRDRIVVKEVPGPVVTRQLPQERVTITVTPSPSPKPKAQVVEKYRVIKISVPKAITYSLGFILLGILIALVLLWALYVVGYKEGQTSNAKFIKELLRDIRLIRS